MVFQMRSSIVLIILFSLIGSSILIPNSFAQEETKIPNWIKNVAGWWANNEISEKEFLAGIEYLINNNIIFLSFIPCGGAAAIAASDPTFNVKLIPNWVKNNAGWWAEDKISDDDFIAGIEYLIKNKIISISSQNNKENSSDVIPSWIKNNAEWWSAGQISDKDFLSGVKYLIENSVIKVSAPTNSELIQKELERKAWNFEQYLKDIQNDIKNQNRYVENINPSEYVIVKYWKDYHKWNLEQYLNKPEIFPDRNVWIDPETDRYVIEYKVYINEQPLGLPIDHVSTLENSFSFWEKYEFDTSDNKKAIINFETTGAKFEANVWVTWVVRNLGEDVLGHANLGKGVVEVAIGSYGCDGSFQLFDVNTVEQIMTHELGHSVSLGHSANPESMMYPSISNIDYAYCLLN